MLNLKNLTVHINKKSILHNINYEFEKGKIYAVMGPNGSGKSTLANSIMGYPDLEYSSQSRIMLNDEDIVDMEVNERAEKGLFLSFQSPLSLSGVRVNQLLQMALSGKKDPLTIRNQVKEIAMELRMSEDLLNRSINVGASGGEKKKMEVLQAMVLDKKVIIFDEVDTGVDVDALKTISQFLSKHRENKTYIVITHYNRILHFLKPDYVLVIHQGRIVKVGDYRLAEVIEKDGYSQFID